MVRAVSGNVDIDTLDRLQLPAVRAHDPGFVLGVAVNGDLVWCRASGVARVAGRPLASDTSVYVASIAKQVTAACFALLVDDGVLTEETELRQCLPELGSKFDGVVLSDLVHHISGVPSLESDGRHEPGSNWWTDLGTWDMVERIIGGDGLATPPGTAYRYANEGYLLLAAVVERAAGCGLNKFATDRLFEPLGMASSWFRDDPHAPQPDAVGHALVDGCLEADESQFHFVGDGGLVTTVKDLARWSTVHTHPYGLGNELAGRLTRHGRLRDGRELHYAWGLSVRPHLGRTIHSHGGQFVGNMAKVVQFPGDPSLTFICLANRDDLDLDTIVRQTTDEALASSLDPNAPDWRATLHPDGLA